MGTLQRNTAKWMVLGTAALLLAGGCANQTQAPNPAPIQPAPRPQPVNSNKNIQDFIIAPKTSKAITDTMPPKWLKSPICTSVSPIETQNEKRARKVLTDEMRKYPIEVLQKNLKYVVLSSRLACYGLPFGGTNSNINVYIPVGDAEMGYTNQFIKETFHHEFSSILMRKDNFAATYGDDWTRANPAGFKYGDGGVKAIRNGKASTKSSKESLQMGFMSPYGMSDIEEDFNTIAEALWTGSEELWKAYDQNGPLKKKVDLQIWFLNGIHPSLNHKFFRSLAKQKSVSFHINYSSSRDSLAA